MNEEMLAFISAITGHDGNTVEQMFDDWQKSSSNKINKRIAWTEFKDSEIIFHYSTRDEYDNCKNPKVTGIK